MARRRDDDAPPVEREIGLIDKMRRLAAAYKAPLISLALVVSARAAEFDARLARGRSLRSEGRPAEARDALNGALSLRPGDASVLIELGAIDNELNRFEDSERELRAALRDRPNDYWLRLQLARSYVGLGRLDSARAEFAAARRIDRKQSSAYIEEGYMDLAAGDGSRAERDVRTLIVVDSANPAGYHHLGSILAFEGRHDEATPYFRMALERFGSWPAADERDRLHTLAWLGDNAYRRGRLNEAEAYYQKGLRDSRSYTDHQAKFLMSLGWVYGSRGRIAAAGDFLERAAAVCGDGGACPGYGPQALLCLADYDLRRGDSGKAKNGVDRAWELLAHRPLPSLMDGQVFSLFDNIGDFYWRLGDWAGAVKAYGHLLPLRKIAPSSPALAKAESGLARVYASQGRHEQAARLYRRASERWIRNGDRAQARTARSAADALDERTAVR